MVYYDPSGPATGIGYPDRARSPSAVVASARGRSTEADQLPPLSTRTGIAVIDATGVTIDHLAANAYFGYHSFLERVV